MSQDVTLNIKAKDQASRVIKGVAKAAVDAAKLLGAASIALAAEAAVAVNASEKQAKAEQKLALALAKTGQLTRENFESAKEYSSALQEVTTAGDEATLELQALAINMGATAEQAKAIAGAAVDMEAALGEDAVQTARKLARTLNGTAGELGEMDKAVKSLTKEQLENGAAVDILAAKYSGFAKSEAATFSGALKQASNAFGDLQEEIGFAVTENEIFVDIANETTDALVDVAAIVKENRGAFAEFVRDGIRVAFNSFDQFLQAVGDSKLVFAFAKQSLLDYAKTAIDSLAPVLSAVFDDDTVENWSASLDEAISKTNEEVKAAQEWRNTVNEVRESFEGVGAALEESVNKPMDDAVDKAEKLKNTLETTEAPEIAGPPTPQTTPEGGEDAALLVKVEEDEIQKAADTLGTAVSVAGASAGGAINAAMQVAIQLAKEVFENVSQEVIKAVASFGPIVAAIIDALASFSVDDFQGLIDGLVKGFVLALSNIGPFLALLANNLDEILQGLVIGIISGVASVVANLPNIVAGLFSAVFEGITQLGPRMREAMSGIGDGVKATFKIITNDFKEAFSNIVESAIQPLVDGLRRFSTLIKDAVKNAIAFFSNEFGDAIRDAARQFGVFVSDNLIDPVATILKSMANAIIGAMNFVIGGLNSLPLVDIPKIPTLHDGGVFQSSSIGGEGLAMLKDDEVVVNGSGQANLLNAIAQGGVQPSGGAPIQVTIQERRESSGEFRQLVMNTLDDLIRNREIQDIRVGAL